MPFLSERTKFALRQYLPQALVPDLRHLYWSALLSNLGQAMVLLFEPVYLYQIGEPIERILLYFIIAYGAYFFLIPLGSRFAERYGYEIGMAVGSVFWMAYFAALAMIPNEPALFYVAPLLLGLQKTFYWMGYHGFFARYVNQSEGGREVGSVFAVASLTYIVGPVFAGLIAGQFGFPAMFGVAMAVLLASNVPLLRHRHPFVPGTYGYRQHWQGLVSLAFRRRLAATIGYGEEFIVLTLWPIFVSLFIPGQLAFGFLITLSSLANALITVVIGKRSDGADKVALLERGTLVYVGSWIARLFVTGPAQAFVVDAWSRVSKDMVAVPLSALIYGQAQGGAGKFSLIQTVTLHETGLILGKLLAAGICLFFVVVVPAAYLWQSFFVAAACFALLYLAYRPAVSLPSRQ